MSISRNLSIFADTVSTSGNAVTAVAVPTLTSASALTFQTNGTTTAMTIDASQNVGIGTSSPNASAKLTLAGTSTNSALLVYNNTAAANTGLFGSVAAITGSGTSNDLAIGAFGSSNMTFYTAAAERMRIDTSGNLLVGTTTLLATGTHSFVNSATPLTLRNSASTAGRYWFTGPDSSASYLIYNNSSVGVYVAYGNTTWSSTSDERMKTDLIPIENAASKVSTLRAVTGRFKTDEEGKSRSFLIAQDVQAVLPEAVDASDPDKLGVQYTDVIPLLVAAIKELSAKVAVLESE